MPDVANVELVNGMTCNECERAQDLGDAVYWFRWKNANVAMLGCRTHIGEIMDVLRAVNREGRV